MDLIKAFTNEQLKTDAPKFDIGNDVKVYCRIVEGERTRTQIFEGTVIAKNGGGIRRRRECLNCKNRFTTYETYELSNTVPLVVIKKDNSLQLFDRNKILTGLLQACYKLLQNRQHL